MNAKSAALAPLAKDIRETFLNYFEKQGHARVESSPLVPQNDPTLLFTNAGMVQFKDVFLGKESRPYRRATTTQKCVRAGGKHNDLENVGFTARHHTFFEMLGNFSFGDYFKKDAIHFAWELVTRELQLPKSRLFVSVFKDDDEAADLWHKQEGVPRDRIYRFGEKDNFWSMGDTGPCGPCSELFIDRGEKYGCGKPSCAVGCDCDRFMEFWNLVFMQYERDASGKLTALPKPSVDTGAGLERLASILQDVPTNYDTDLFQEIIGRTAQLARRRYDPHSRDESVFSFRIVADHSRAAAFLIGDGVMPSNEGRGYVLRRILRRAIRHGKKLGFEGPFMHQTVGYVVDQMQSAFPDLTEKRAFIEKAVHAEEDQFFRTLERGLSLLDEETQRLHKGQSLPGEVAFKLYDTYGFPVDLTRVICAEKGMGVDEAGFETAMEKQRAESRKHWKGSGETAVDVIYMKVAERLRTQGKQPQFTGYTSLVETAECVAILAADPATKALREVDAAPVATGGQTPSETVQMIFSRTPFYGESGGQAGDRGRVRSSSNSFSDDFEGEVLDVTKPTPELIVAHVRVTRGIAKVGTAYTQETDAQLRALTARNHTATHLLHWALREVLGKHVKQAGSLVASDLLRFDFSHFQALTAEELSRIESMINAKIWNAARVTKAEMPKDEAIAAGAIAFFGEKYGDRVRVIQVSDGANAKGFSVELCGGTHVDNASDIHLFKIGNESGIAAGVRRIVAYTSKGAFDYLRAADEELKQVRDRLKASSTAEILGKLDKLFLTERDLRKQIESFQSQNAGQEVNALLQSAQEIAHAGGKTALIAAACSPNAQGVKALRDLSDRIKQKHPDSVAILGMAEPSTGKAFLLVSVGPKAPKALDANAILKEISPLIDGRGGGKPDLAQAGGTNPDGLPAAIDAGRKAALGRLGV